MNKEQEYLFIIKNLLEIIDAYGVNEGYTPNEVVNQMNTIEKWRHTNKMPRVYEGNDKQ
jgi:hypothetical protein